MGRDQKTKRIAELASKESGSTASPTFVSVTVTDLDGSRIVVTDSGSTLATEDYLQHNSTTHVTRLGNVAAGNYIEIEADGTLEFLGNATVWEDLRVPVTSVKTGGIHDPGFAVFRKNAAGTSAGVFCYHFDNVTEEELFFAVQIPHSYRLGTDLTPHVHWGVPTVPAGGTTVKWGLEYTIANTNATFLATDTIYTIATDPVTQYKLHLNNFTDISGAFITDISSMILCRVFRDVAGDNFAADACLFEIDFHYESDTIGSRQITSK